MDNFGPSFLRGKEKYTHHEEHKFRVQSSMFKVGVPGSSLVVLRFGWKMKGCRSVGRFDRPEEFGGP